MYVFDMDGCLFDTQELIREAYKRAGVTPPPDFWGKTAREWVPYLPENQGNQSWKYTTKNKNIHYRMLVQERGINTLPAGLAARRLWDRVKSDGYDPSKRVFVLTGASRIAVEIVQNATKFPYPVLGLGCSKKDKVEKLLTLPPGTIYVDDNRDLGPEIAQESYCTWIDPTGKTENELYNEILAKEDLWMRLF